MSEITKADVEYVAGLAQLSLSDAAKEKLARELGDILTYIEQLNELDTEGIEPMMHAMPLTNVLREDKVEPCLPRELALKNAPNTDGEYFLVPKILGGSE
ncbi:MAG: Asp-tRNA(Asn)/Glu-tRNA(Gln) amidotransferase subunit GatC [Candidatus Hydrogenedens sp.]|nr:Asp-tRNA(Asn)/Glu-tRNA(Gln) amidotransferase subunit GatC [Candidatus Hydrogenedens sp.]